MSEKPEVVGSVKHRCQWRVESPSLRPVSESPVQSDLFRLQCPVAGLALGLHMTELPGLECQVLAVARDDCKIHLYCREGERTWVRASGHEDWVVSAIFSLFVG